MDRERLIALYKQGLNDQEIADIMRYSPEWIRQMRRKLGLTKQVQLSQEEDSRRMELYRRGLSDAEMAKVCGISTDGIRYWRRQKGLPAKKKGGRPKVTKQPLSHSEGDSFIGSETNRLRALLIATQERRKRQEKQERAFRAMYRVYADGTVENHLFPWMDTYTPRAENERAQ